MSHKCQSILHAPNGQLLGELASVSADFAHGHVIPEHSHPEDQLLFASSGVMTLHTKQGVWVVPPMRAVWIPADTPHSVAMSGLVSMRTLYFLPKLCRRLREKCFVMNVSALLRELILHACKFKRLRRKALAERRIIEMIVEQLKAVDSIPLQLPHPTDSRAMRELMHRVFDRYQNPEGPSKLQPLTLATPDFNTLFRKHVGRLTRTAAIRESLKNIWRHRHGFRVNIADPLDFNSRFILRELPAGLIDKVYQFAKKHGASVNDAFIAGQNFSYKALT